MSWSQEENFSSPIEYSTFGNIRDASLGLVSSDADCSPLYWLKLLERVFPAQMLISACEKLRAFYIHHLIHNQAGWLLLLFRKVSRHFQAVEPLREFCCLVKVKAFSRNFHIF